ncbi:Origin recognition complex subunit 1 [Babesia sp. Xinjiang]|uniref:Origin recognition complex subunit 1 n=1 Tax=Babesia sp. Xinjiang TaxID=462227 RepID=UPI000A227AE6|nr:Origin recognition complex subunit 1 [Babesia sp. Xinjiang]XP_028871410.1 Origin recognition complex subunit 1 [Babesia sp. Xinjiang]ORM40850.1 Origin recognition complex subunit 1 [Babesia sp. Xinjiang]ORM40954.1 Origin recognition complex subunit 1 [Babesia sp. Xinjiang]
MVDTDATSPTADSITCNDAEKLLELQKKAIELLRLSDNTYLGCRDEEAESLRKIIESRVGAKAGGGVFVFGVSGTGKTTTVTHVVGRFDAGKPKLRKLYMSGTSYISTWHLLDSFYEMLIRCPTIRSRLLSNVPKTKKLSYREMVSALASAFKTTSTYTICVMDEVDFLQSMTLKVAAGRKSNWMLQALLAASHAPGSRVLFIAISNNLRLATLITERQCRVVLFKPYNEKQIIAIIKKKLEKLDEPYTAVIKDTSLLLLARRVANTTGDLRACLDTFTRALATSMSNLTDELQHLTPVTDYSSNSNENSPEKSIEEAETPKRGYGDMANSIELDEYKVDHKDIGSLTPTLSLSKTALIELKVKPLPLMQLLALLSICKASIDEHKTVVSYDDVKISLLHIADLLTMEKTCVEDFCMSQLKGAIDIFKELGLVSKVSPKDLEDGKAAYEELISLLVDAETLVQIVLPISPAFVGLDLGFPYGYK